MTALATSCQWGNFFTDVDPNPAAWFHREQQLGTRFDYASTFITFDSTPATRGGSLTGWANAGRAILLAWQPARATTGMRLADIITGRHDAHIDSWIGFLAGLKTRVVIRFGHEFNGWWSRWNPAYTGPGSSRADSPEDFIAAWRYIHARAYFVADNLRWLWCANRSDWGGYPMEAFWPGAEWVDYVGYDSYCGLSRWSTPLDTVRGMNPGTLTAYSRVTALHPNAKVIVAEMGCVDPVTDPTMPNHSKADWYRELFALDHALVPRLAAISFFDAVGTRDWRHDTSPGRPGRVPGRCDVSLKGARFSHWNYRVVRRSAAHPDGTTEVAFAIHECYYDPVGWTVEPVPVEADSVNGLREVLTMMLTALEIDVIEDAEPRA